MQPVAGSKPSSIRELLPKKPSQQFPSQAAHAKHLLGLLDTREAAAKTTSPQTPTLWCLEFEDATGRRRREVARDKRGHNSQEVAEAILRQRYKEVVTHEYVAPSQAIRFDELTKRFIASKHAEVRGLTVDDYQSIIDRG